MYKTETLTRSCKEIEFLTVIVLGKIFVQVSLHVLVLLMKEMFIDDIWVNEPNVVYSQSFAFLDLPSAYKKSG